MTYDDFKKFLEEFNKIKSFKGRIDYANQNLTRIGGGSSRIVYDIDGTKVFKLAKNSKGIEQNDVESSIGRDSYIKHLVASVYEFADDDTWIVAEKVKPVNENRIKELTGISSLSDLGKYLSNFQNRNHSRREIYHLDPKLVDELDNNEFVVELIDFISGYNQNVGDLNRPSTYGEVLKDGQPVIVIADYGLSDDVYNKYYSPKRRYKLYELYNFNDGNDDILSDIGNVSQEVRHGMWGLVPYSVGDDASAINEKFINFVENHQVYPDGLNGVSILSEEFHNCVNNIKEYINRSKNKKQFYNNLISLQEYLKSKALYNRDPLYIEEAEDPNVIKYSLDDKNYADELANMVVSPDNLNLGAPTYLGGGGYGFAYVVNGNKILKITSDISEADAGMKINRGNPRTLAHVYGVWKIIDSEKNMAFYAILQENIINKPENEFVRYNNIIDMLAPSPDLELAILAKKMKKDFNYNDAIERGKFILTSKPEANITQDEREKTYKYYVGLVNIQKELLEYDVKSTDFSNPGNLGYKNGVLTFFDIGGYSSVEPPVQKLYLPEEEILSEGIDRDIANNVANQIAKMKNLTQLTYVGEGMFGIAYDIGNDRILKITSDKSEAAENLRLKGKPLKYIAEPYEILSIKPKSGSTLQGKEIYAIILEKLKTNPDYFKRMKDRMDYAFSKIMDVKFEDVIDNYLYDYGYDNKIDKNKVNSYLEKNPEDKNYFNSILNIAKEAQQYGVESMDYLNINNLGYKKDGNLGFFDVGFGNWFMQTQNQPQEIEVDEDGSAKFSTDNAISQDEFPVYNQNDTTPLTDNNIPVNVNSESTEINERIKSYMPNSTAFDVKDKCRLGSNHACNQGDINNFNFSSINEEIDASELHSGDSDRKSIETVINGRRNLALVSLGLNPMIKKMVEDNGLNYIVVKQDSHPESIQTSIVYRDGYEQQANQLHDIMKSHGGYVADESPEEAYKIGKLLGYTDDSIKKYVDRIYKQDQNGNFIRRTFNELIQYDRENSVVYENNLTTFAENNLQEADIMNIKDLPFKDDIERIGGKIFSVGGAVRDEFLGKESKDLDILITGVPFEELEQILSKYGRVDAVGKSFGILKFKPSGATEEIDIAIPRTEKPTGEGGYHGFEVKSDHALPIEKDLERRDFTINAIAKDINGNLIDPYGGQKDLQNKIIRVVNPEAFSDDPLRMLRAVQFASRFGFTIEPNTMKMIQGNASRISEIPPERILIEFDKIVKKGNPMTGAMLLIETGLFQQIFGKPKKISDIFSKVKTMGEFIYLLCQGTVENPAEFYLSRFSNEDAKRDKIYKEIKALDFAFKNDTTNIIAARSIAHNMYLYSSESLQSQIIPNTIKIAAQELLQGKYPKTVNELAVNGNDLMQLGLKGKEIGDTQKSLLLKLYADKVRNNKDELLSLVSQVKPIKEETVKKIRYSGVVLDDKSRQELLQEVGHLIPEGWETIAHHMTINLGELAPDMKTHIGKEVDLMVDDYAINDKVFAVGVNGYPTRNAKPHITIAVNRQEGGKPMMSNNLTNWKKIKNPFIVTGIITEVE